MSILRRFMTKRNTYTMLQYTCSRQTFMKEGSGRFIQTMHALIHRAEDIESETKVSFPISDLRAAFHYSRGSREV
jgi:hypothetical protein